MFTTLSALTPWQALIWWVCFLLVTIPLLIFMANAVVIGYFKVKEQHAGKLIKAFGETISQFGKDITGKIKGTSGENKGDFNNVN